MTGLRQPGFPDVLKGLGQGIQRALVFEDCILLRLNFDPAVLLGQVVELADFDTGDVLETTLAIRIAADAVGYFAFLTGNFCPSRE